MNQSIDLRYTIIQEKVPNFIYQGLGDYVKYSNNYYSQPKFLRKSLATKFKLPLIDWVFLTNGVDEIFGEYAPHLSIVDLLPKYENLVIFKGFSKGYGMPGIRLGFILANPKTIEKIQEKTTWSNVSYLSCGAAQIALEHEKYFKDLRESILERKKNCETT